ncbi:hypothetical protein AB0O72_03420 [Streptomyces sp. NPDC088106]|uniref:hypothetical protein n=1 Tax=Streptomyces sp. NPDC088106 TaxID=3154867 RepID=UPI00344A6562
MALSVSRLTTQLGVGSLVTVDSLLTTLVAVSGTVLGVVVTQTFHGRNAKQAQRFTIAERLRQDRITAYAEFARSVMEFRSSQYRRWRQRNTGHANERYEEARYDSHQRRALAWQALYRVRLVADEGSLVALGSAAMDLATQIDEAGDIDELREIGSKTRLAVEEFIDRAAKQIS